MNLTAKYKILFDKIEKFTSFCDLIRLMKHMAGLDKLKDAQRKLKHKKSTSFLSRCRYGSCTPLSRNGIVNLSSYTLSGDEGFVLSHGLNHYIAPSTTNQEEVSCSFESMAVSLTHLVPSSKTNRDHTITRFTELAHSFSNTPVEVGDRHTLPLFRKALKALETWTL